MTNETITTYQVTHEQVKRWQQALRVAISASICTCGIDTLAYTHHKPDCSYRIRQGAIVELDLLTPTAQEATVNEQLLSAMETVLRISDRKHDAWDAAKAGIAAARSAQTAAYRAYSARTAAPLPTGVIETVQALLHQIDIGDFVDGHGHSAKMLKPVHDLMTLLTCHPAPPPSGERAAQPVVVPSSLPEWDNTKPNNQQGLYQKFIVRRVDGSDAAGNRHAGCEYFVLDVTHDQHAPAALRAYAESCATTHPQLSDDLKSKLGAQQVAVPMMDMVDAAMVEMQNIHPPLRRSECERLIRAALDTTQTNLSNKRNQT